MREKLGYVVESDLDLILVLDAWTGGPLTPYLARRAGVALGSPLKAARSTLHRGGMRETDVEIAWPGGILRIEDKIDAPFTSGQPECYRIDVEERRARGEAAASILVCPERRRQRLEEEANGAFDAIVTCEELAGVADGAGSGTTADAIVLRAAAQARPTRPVTSIDQVRSNWETTIDLYSRRSRQQVVALARAPGAFGPRPPSG